MWWVRYPLVLDLRIDRERFGSSSDPNLNGHLQYPNDIDKSLHESVTDKIRIHLIDCNNNPPNNSISFMPSITSTSGRLHSDFVCLSFYKFIGKLAVFFTVSGAHLVYYTSVQFHYHPPVVSSQLRSRIGSILTKVATLRITLNIDGSPI